MFKAKPRTRVIVLLLLSLVICAYINAATFVSFEPLNLAAAVNESSESTSSFLSNRQIYSILDMNDNPQITRTSSAARTDYAGRLGNIRSVSVASQILLGSSYGVSKSHNLCPFFPAAASKKIHLSVLAFSLGGNSPPVYHA